VFKANGGRGGLWKLDYKEVKLLSPEKDKETISKYAQNQRICPSLDTS